MFSPCRFYGRLIRVRLTVVRFFQSTVFVMSFVKSKVKRFNEIASKTILLNEKKKRRRQYTTALLKIIDILKTTNARLRYFTDIKYRKYFIKRQTNFMYTCGFKKCDGGCPKSMQMPFQSKYFNEYLLTYITD